MRSTLGTACAALLLLGSVPLAAQEEDSFVLPRGVARASVTGVYTHFDTRFVGGGSEALANPFLAPLSSLSFAPLRPLEAELNRFFAETGGGVTATPANLLLGTPELAVGLDARVVPLRLEVGALPRLELGVELPIHRGEVRLTRFALSGGTVGANPEPADNAEALAALGESFRALGALPILPTAGSALGMALVERLRAAAPEAELELPEAAADTTLLRALLAADAGVDTLRSAASPWRVGDVEVGGQFRLLSTFGAAPYPADSGRVHYRVSASASARIPTGSEAALVPLFTALPPAGVAGFGAGAEADVYWGRRLWVTATARYTALAATEVSRRVADPELPLAAPGTPQRVEWDPADGLHLLLLPRLRITDALSLGAEYRVTRVGETTYALAGGGGGAEILNLEGGTAQSLGVSARYGTLGHYLAGADLTPVELVFSWRRALAGPPGYPEASTVEARASIFRSLWGRRR